MRTRVVADGQQVEIPAPQTDQKGGDACVKDQPGGEPGPSEGAGRVK